MPRDEATGLLKLSDAAAMLGISTRTVRRLVAEGEIKWIRIHRLVRLDVADVLRFIEAQKGIS
jgi:excisionase family DNA binding protein